MRRPRRAWPSRARATVVLPEPDSPTRPSTSPAWTANEISLTTSWPDPARHTARSVTLSLMPRWAGVVATGGAGLWLIVFLPLLGGAPPARSFRRLLAEVVDERRLLGSAINPDRHARERVGERVPPAG